MRKQLTLLTALSILSVSSFTLSGCSSSPLVQASASQTPAVRLFTLNGQMAPGASGKIAPSQTVRIYSKIQGRIADVLVEEGSKVKKGDVLVQLDTADLIQQVNQAQSNLDAAQARLNETLNGARPQDLQAAEGAVGQAKAAQDTSQASIDQAKSVYDMVVKTYNQVKNYYEEGSAAKSELDNATLNHDKAKAAYEQALAGQASSKAALSVAQAKLDMLRAGATADTIAVLQAQLAQTQAMLEIANNAVDNASIKAPSDGIIVKRNVQPGEIAFASSPAGTELLTIASMDKVKVELSVPETLVTLVKEGTAVKVTLPSIPDKTFDGTVSFISPVSDQNNNTFPVKIMLDNPQGELRAGAITTVQFGGVTGQSRLELPKSALVKDGSEFVVFKLEGNVVRKVSVQTEEKSQELVYLKEGALQSHDKIVLNPSDKLSDGASVQAE